MYKNTEFPSEEESLLYFNNANVLPALIAFSILLVTLTLLVIS